MTRDRREIKIHCELEISFRFGASEWIEAFPHVLNIQSLSPCILRVEKQRRFSFSPFTISFSVFRKFRRRGEGRGFLPFDFREILVGVAKNGISFFYRILHASEISLDLSRRGKVSPYGIILLFFQGKKKLWNFSLSFRRKYCTKNLKFKVSWIKYTVVSCFI